MKPSPAKPSRERFITMKTITVGTSVGLKNQSSVLRRGAVEPLYDRMPFSLYIYPSSPIMRRLLTLLAGSLLCSALSHAQFVTIPDTTFRNVLITKYPTCFNANKQMDTTCTSILNETSLNFENNNAACKYIDFTGILYFKNLKTFNCNHNCGPVGALPNSLEVLYCSGSSGPKILPSNLKRLICPGSYDSLPILPGTLKYLDCSFNNLAFLPTLPASLEYLDCSINKLPVLPVLPQGLDTLNCNNNQIVSLSGLPNSLRSLAAESNLLSSLPGQLPSSLQYLGVDHNSISDIPSLPPALIRLRCTNNKLTSLPVLPNSLVLLQIDDNHLTGLPTLPANLEYIYCRNNLLTSLPNLPGKLWLLDCTNNSLSSLPNLPANLVNLYCAKNLLTSLPKLPKSMSSLEFYRNNIYCLPVLPVNAMLIFDGDKIACVPNIPSNCTFAKIVDPDRVIYQPIIPVLCNPATNKNHCRSFPVMSGIVFFDDNNNGIKDAGEVPKQGAKIQLSANLYAFTDSNGHYEIAADTIGAQTLSILAPAYFNATPANVSYNFSTFDTSVIQHIALKASSVKDSLSISISPLVNARPGFAFLYLVKYENVGTTALSPIIVINYNSNSLVYDSSSNTSLINNGSNLSLNNGILLPGQKGHFVAFFTVKTGTVLGDTLFSQLNTSANGHDYTDSIFTVVGGSFDPNDKQATPQLSPSQVAEGTYINYTIRFQNTGTDTAFNVVISDTLSNQLEWNTVEVLNASHQCKTTVTGNKVYFEFRNILLPDSNVNEKASHGLVSFRVKPKGTVTLNTSITNKASIYFDYNLPVATNTVNTLINDLPSVYTFTGKGNWSNTSNWLNGMVPVNPVPRWITIFIDPPFGEKCILDVPLTIVKGAKIILKEGKNIVIGGNLTIK